MKTILIFLATFLFTFVCFTQPNASCETMDKICFNPNMTFTALSNQQDASVDAPGNNYDCLVSTPNPTWFYLEIGSDGNLQMNLNAPQDIDFIIWGPFADSLDAFSQCGNLGNGGSGQSVVDCSYSSTNNETPEIIGSLAGEVYIMLVTNYANTTQTLELVQVSGASSLDCSWAVPNCELTAGTYKQFKNGVLQPANIVLCTVDEIMLASSQDYILSNDTIPQPFGDGIYSAQLGWLVYDNYPSSSSPQSDPGFLNFIIPGDTLFDVYDSSSPILQNFGCGTYYYVPVTLQDGIGGNNNIANGTNDNGALDWDKTGDDCFALGTPIEVNYSCLSSVSEQLNCQIAPPKNAVDISISSFEGPYSIGNNGDGLLSTGFTNGQFEVYNLMNGDEINLTIQNAAGCTQEYQSIFNGPDINNVDITPASECPGTDDGSVEVEVMPSINSGPYIFNLNGVMTSGTTASYNGLAGELVEIYIRDGANCHIYSTATITSDGHYIDLSITDLQMESCFGAGDGHAEISAIPLPSGNVTSIVWSGPNSEVISGDGSLTSQGNLSPGFWTVCATDDHLTGCQVCTSFEISVEDCYVGEYELDKEILIYPNVVVNDFVHIKSNLKFESIELFDITGKLIMTFNSESKSLNIRPDLSGQFILKLQSGASIYQERLIIK